MKEKICLVILGPTAVGKTTLAITLAQQLHCKIISADSRQCFKELNVGVAKPSQSQLDVITHYFINSHSIAQDINAKVFESYALDISAQLFLTNDILIVAGGTGLYIKSFLEGLDAIPGIDPSITNTLNSQYLLEGLIWLQNQVRFEDPIFFNAGEIMNPHRCLRALSVKRATGKSIIEFHSGIKKERPFKTIKIGLQLPRELIINNINLRVDEMISTGLISEVEKLISYKNLPALQTVGYKELFEYFDNNISLPQAIEKIKINTRQFAKRQMTWFKKDPDINWLDMTLPPSEIVDQIQSLLLHFKT